MAVFLWNSLFFLLLGACSSGVGTERSIKATDSISESPPKNQGSEKVVVEYRYQAGTLDSKKAFYETQWMGDDIVYSQGQSIFTYKLQDTNPKKLFTQEKLWGNFVTSTDGAKIYETSGLNRSQLKVTEWIREGTAWSSKLIAEGFFKDPVYSKEKNTLIYVAVSGGKSALFLKKDSHSPKVLWVGDGEIGTPRLSGNNLKLVWRMTPKGRKDLSDIFVADLEWAVSGLKVKDVLNLTQNRPGLYLSPSLNQDGSYVFFSTDTFGSGHLEIGAARTAENCFIAITQNGHTNLYPAFNDNLKKVVWVRHREDAAIQILFKDISFTQGECR